MTSYPDRSRKRVFAELGRHLAKVPLPSAQFDPGRYFAESDDMIAFLAVKSGREPTRLTSIRKYGEGTFKIVTMGLFKEDQ